MRSRKNDPPRALRAERLTRASLAGELVGLAEAAELLAISKAALCERRRAGVFPEPVAELRCGPIWLRREIERHAALYRPDRGGWRCYSHGHLFGRR
jgi:hypothetical protein